MFRGKNWKPFKREKDPLGFDYRGRKLVKIIATVPEKRERTGWILHLEKLLGIKMEWSIWVIFLNAFILLIWIILKLLGTINTPLLLQMIPYLTGFGFVVGFGVACGRFLQKIDFLGKEFYDFKNEMKWEIKELRSSMHTLEKDMGIVKHKLQFA